MLSLLYTHGKEGKRTQQSASGLYLARWLYTRPQWHWNQSSSDGLGPDSVSVGKGMTIVVICFFVRGALTADDLNGGHVHEESDDQPGWQRDHRRRRRGSWSSLGGSTRFHRFWSRPHGGSDRWTRVNIIGMMMGDEGDGCSAWTEKK